MTSTKSTAPVVRVPIGKIDLHSGTQTRAEVRLDVVDEYSECAFDLPPVVLFTEDEETYWPGSGHHRIPAWEKAGWTAVPADVRKGNKRDAILFGVGSDAANGMRRTPEDKRQAVKILLADPEWGNATDRWIAEAARVSHPFVATVRAECPAGNNGQSGGEENSNGNVSNPGKMHDGGRNRKGGGSYPAKKSLKCDVCKSKRLNLPDCPACARLREDKDAKKAAEAADKKAKADQKAKEKADREAAAAKIKTDREAEKTKKAAEKEAADAEKKRKREEAEAKKEADRKAKEEAAKEKAKPAGPETVEETMRRVNGLIESFCRGLMKFADDNLPEDHWLSQDNCREGAVRKFKDGCDMLRSKKCSALCPVCEGAKKGGDGKKCRPCHGMGRMPKLNLDMVAT